jgi:hypothetical protein
MSKSILSDLESSNKKISISCNTIPDTCPYCKKKILPIFRYAYTYDTEFLSSEKRCSQVVFQCPDQECYNLFVAEYEGFSRIDDELLFKEILHLEPDRIVLSEIISDFSSNFTEIYNQSYMAEQLGLDQICGTGYRKSLEFLLKDFAIKESKNENEKEIIKRSFLSNVIRDYVKDENIKKVASRASWLGNDETHYLRIWEKKDLQDLKLLINLTIKWIEMLELTKYYESEMPIKN